MLYNVAARKHLFEILSYAAAAVAIFAGALIAANNYALQAGKYMQAQNIEKGVEYLEKAAGSNPLSADYHGSPALIEAKMAALDETEKKLWNVAPIMSATPAVRLNAGASQYLLGRWPEAEEDFQAALQNDQTKGEASLWLALLRDKQVRS